MTRFLENFLQSYVIAVASDAFAGHFWRINHEATHV